MLHIYTHTYPEPIFVRLNISTLILPVVRLSFVHLLTWLP